MKVKELIKDLQAFPQDADVIISIADEKWYELQFADDSDCIEEHPEIVLFAEDEVQTWSDFLNENKENF